MNDINGGVSSVLAQIRAMRTQMDGVGAATGAASPVSAAQPKTETFASALTKAVNTVSQTQEKASAMADAFERGDRSQSLSQVMLSMQQAQVSFKALSEVRNRLVQAYQDIQNMPL